MGLLAISWGIEGMVLTEYFHIVISTLSQRSKIGLNAHSPFFFVCVCVCRNCGVQFEVLWSDQTTAGGQDVC